MTILQLMGHLAEMYTKHGDIDVHLEADREGDTMEPQSVSDAQFNSKGKTVVVISAWEPNEHDLHIW